MKKLKIAYFGTPSFSADFLEKIILDKKLPVEVAFVVTQPDKKVGRKQILTPSPVKVIAEKYRIPVRFMKNTETGGARQGVELALLFAFGEIIPKDILDIPRLGFWNVHLSLLPKYRGASPTAFSLILGDTETGVTLTQMDELLDHGPIIAQEKMPINSTDKRSDIEKKLTDLGLELLKKTIRNLSNLSRDRSRPVPTQKQNHSQATLTFTLSKDDGFIPFNILQKALKNEPLSPEELPKVIKNYYQNNDLDLLTADCRLPTILYNLFRGLYPWPGLWTMYNHPGGDRMGSPGVKRVNKRLKITDIELKNNQLIIKKVQLEGKKEVNFKQFNEAYNIY